LTNATSLPAHFLDRRIGAVTVAQVESTIAATIHVTAS